jgi:hypothetical protein
MIRFEALVKHFTGLSGGFLKTMSLQERNVFSQCWCCHQHFSLNSYVDAEKVVDDHTNNGGNISPSS